MYQTDPITFNNIFKDIPARKLPESALQDGLNIIFDNGIIKPRYGIAEFGADPLNDNITGISLYKKLRSTDRYVIAFTNKDIYVYDKITGKFKYKTRNYATGTVTTSGTGNLTVTLSGGTWQTAWNQTNLYEISFDSADIDDCNIWYKVKSVDTSTKITISDTETVTAKTGSVYCLRLCYAGDADDVWHSCYPYEDASADRIILATNGIDEIQQWDGSGSFKNFAAYPHRVKYVGFFGSTGWEHVILANYYDTVSQISFEQTIQWLDAGGALDWNGHYAELIDNKDAITGVLPLGSRLLIYKSNSISIAEINPNGGNIEPFYFKQNVVEFGTPSIRTVCSIGSLHLLFTGYDIRAFDGFNHKVISDGNTQNIVKSLNKEYQHRSFAFILPEQSLYCLFIPTGDSEYCDMCIVYNYTQQSWTYWSMKDVAGNTFQPMSKGKYQRTYAPRWEDLLVRPTANTINGSNNITVSSTDGISIGMKVVGAGIQTETYVNNIAGNALALSKPATATATGIETRIGWTAAQMEQRWVDLIIDERYTRIIFGDADGYLYTYAVDFTDDNNYPIASNFMTKDFALNRPEHDFRLLECIVSMQLKDGYAPATVDIRASVDFGRNWTPWQTIPLDGHGTYMEKKIHYNVVGKQVRFNVRMSNPMIFESMIIGFNAQYKSMKFDN